MQSFPENNKIAVLLVKTKMLIILTINHHYLKNYVSNHSNKNLISLLSLNRYYFA